MEDINVVKIISQKDRTVTVDGNLTHVTPSRVERLFREVFGDLDKEYLVAMYLNKKRTITAIEILSIGTLNSSLLHCREAFKTALINGYKEMIICHNHPSFDSEPSNEDKSLTRRLIDVAEMLDITIIDHVVIGAPGNEYSFRRNHIICDDDIEDFLYYNESVNDPNNRRVSILSTRQETNMSLKYNTGNEHINDPWKAFTFISKHSEGVSDKFGILTLNTKGRVNKFKYYDHPIKEYSKKEILTDIILSNANKVMIVMHREGSLAPKSDERIASRGLQKCTKILGVEIIDIINTDSHLYFSYKENVIL